MVWSLKKRGSAMKECLADPSTTARWCAAKQSDKIIPQWNLRQSCLRTVKDSILGWSRTRRTSLDYQSNRENPFLQYPMHLRHELLMHLMRLKPTGRELLKAVELLAYSGIPSFDLSYLDDCKFTDVECVLQILIKNGACLRELTLAGQWLYHKSSSNLVNDLIVAACNLEQLRLQHTTEKGHELELVISSCPKLRKLEIMHPSAEDADIEALLDFMNRNRKLCDEARRNLVEIKVPSSVNGTSVMTLFRAFPNLQYLSCTYLDHLLDELEDEEASEWWRGRTSKIRGIKANLPVSVDSVSILVEWFPNLEEVSLEVQDDMSLQPLSLLPNLRSLELKNSPTLPLSYIDEILPLLSVCGEKLTSLSLERFDIVDLAKTAIYCPKLCSFSAQWFTLLGTAVPRGVKRPFLNLRYLRLRPLVNRKVTPEACEILLTNSISLRHLELYCSDGLTDELVSKVTKNNQFQDLRTLRLRHGHNLSSTGIQQLTRHAERLASWDVGMVSSKQESPI